MPYLKMTISDWDRGEAADEPTVKDVCETFNLAAVDIQREFGVVAMEPGRYTVMVTAAGAKKMLAAHIDNIMAGKGPAVQGPDTLSRPRPISFP